ncbi:50S ribosomal protein L13 [Patescibacteria group bacterium]
MAKIKQKKSSKASKKSSPKKVVKKKVVKKVKKPKKVLQREWYLFDCSKKPLGRISTRIAKILMGKHKVSYAPYLDQGDFVIVINADKVYLTGKKMDQKVYRHHTGYPQGLREKSFRDVLKENPKDIVYKSVKGMLPNNSLRIRMLKRLKIYTSAKHPHKNKVKEFKL